SELVDQASGVSVRLTIALLENVTSNAERRALRLGRKQAVARLADLFAAESAVTGKIELVFEGEREGPAAVADRILGEGVLAVFQRHFPAPYRSKQRGQEPVPKDAYKPIVDWFAAGHSVVVQDEAEDVPELREIPTLTDLVHEHLQPAPNDLTPACELVLEGLHRSALLAKDKSPDGATYGDMLKGMFAGFDE
ncbi:MAG: magnesium chelatase, partial [Planctomycetota bacterium]